MLAGLLPRLALLAVATLGAPHASLRVKFAPGHPGAGTNLSFSFGISAAAGTIAPALTGLRVGLPAGLGIDTAGVAGCTVARLHGGGCPPDAQVGQGTVSVVLPLGEAVRTERAKLSVYKGPRAHGEQTLLFDAIGRVPIYKQFIFAAAIHREGSRDGSSIQASIPPEPTLPNSPDAAIASLDATLGTLGRPYYQRRGRRRVAVVPRGITLPRNCPGGGLQFTAGFSFQDGSVAAASARAACGG